MTLMVPFVIEKLKLVIGALRGPRPNGKRGRAVVLVVSRQTAKLADDPTVRVNNSRVILMALSLGPEERISRTAIAAMPITILSGKKPRVRIAKAIPKQRTKTSPESTRVRFAKCIDPPARQRQYGRCTFNNPYPKEPIFYHSIR